MTTKKTTKTELVRSEPQQIAPVSNGDGLILMLERLATNPDVDVAKLERLIVMQERILDRNAKTAFDTAFSAMQAEIPTIVERGRTDKTSYATLEDIVEAVRPVLHKHGFSLAHRTEHPDGQVRVVGMLTHVDGHTRESQFIANADITGSKNAIQALGSSNAYGRRYTTYDLLGITTRGEDKDGNVPSKRGQPPQASRGPAPVGHTNAKEDEPITEPQVRRLITIATKHGRTDAQVKAYLLTAYGNASKKAIKRKDYDDVIAAVEASGVLEADETTSRIPGEEG